MQVFSPSLSEGATIFKEVLWVSAFHANEVRRGLSAEPLHPELSQFPRSLETPGLAQDAPSTCQLPCGSLPSPLTPTSSSWQSAGTKSPTENITAGPCCVQGKLP